MLLSKQDFAGAKTKEYSEGNQHNEQREQREWGHFLYLYVTSFLYLFIPSWYKNVPLQSFKDKSASAIGLRSRVKLCSSVPEFVISSREETGYRRWEILYKVMTQAQLQLRATSNVFAFLSIAAENLCSFLVVFWPSRASVQHDRSKTSTSKKNNGIPQTHKEDSVDAGSQSTTVDYMSSLSNKIKFSVFMI